MKNAEKLEKLYWFRGTQLELTQIALRLYHETKEKQFLNHAKEFGKRSEDIKNTIKKHENR